MKASGAMRAMVNVGTGRGCIIEGPRGRLIVTAASCIPKCSILAPVRPVKHFCGKLVAELGNEPRIGVTCLFADSVTNIAVLGPLRGHSDESEAARFDALVNAGKALPVATASNDSGSWILGLDAIWISCRVQFFGGPLWLSGVSDAITAGLCGSPIVDHRGSAIGLVSVLAGGAGDIITSADSGPNPNLMRSVPGRFIGRSIARTDVQMTQMAI